MTETLPDRTLGPFTPAEVARYATASGDTNPIHLDPAAAAAAGLTGPIVHGMMVMAHLVRIAEAWRPGEVVTMARVLFVRPVGLGEPLAVDGRVVDPRPVLPDGHFTLRLVARTKAGAIAAVVEINMAAGSCKPS